MIEKLKQLKLDRWYGLTLYIGLLATIGAVSFQIDFLDRRKLFGLGIGLIAIGLSYFIAEEHFYTVKPPNVYTGGTTWIKWRVISHNWVTLILFVIGFILALFFGITLIFNLVQ